MLKIFIQSKSVYVRFEFNKTFQMLFTVIITKRISRLHVGFLVAQIVTYRQMSSLFVEIARSCVFWWITTMHSLCSFFYRSSYFQIKTRSLLATLLIVELYFNKFFENLLLPSKLVLFHFCNTKQLTIQQ